MGRARIVPESNVAKYVIEYHVDDRFVGSCCVLVHTNSKARVMIVDDVWIEENSRGFGHGTGLIAEALEFARANRIDSVELTVNPENVIARNLYRKMGFEETDKKYCRRILNVK